MQPDTSLIIALLGLIFMGAYGFAEFTKRRTLTRTAIIFVLMGVVLGPFGVGFISASDLVNWRPGVGLLLGWVGLEIGLGISFRRDGRLADGALRAGLIYLAVGGAGFALVAWGLLTLIPGHGLSGRGAVVVAAIIGLISATGAPVALRTVMERFSATGLLAETGESLAKVIRFTALLLFCLLLTYQAPLSIPGLRAFTPAETILAHMTAGLLLGLAADAFLGDKSDDIRLFLVLLGVGAIGTGGALHFGFSPLLVNLMIGFSLANFGRLDADRHRVLMRLEEPTGTLLLIYAGAVWIPQSESHFYLLVFTLVALRPLMLWVAGGAAARSLDPQNPFLGRIGFTLVGQGAPAVALALAFFLQAGMPGHQLLLTLALLSTALNDLWSGHAVRIVLDEAGEIPTLVAEA